MALLLEVLDLKRTIECLVDGLSALWRLDDFLDQRA
jgi:hypothetical protein